MKFTLSNAAISLLASIASVQAVTEYHVKMDTSEIIPSTADNPEKFNISILFPEENDYPAPIQMVPANAIANVHRRNTQWHFYNCYDPNFTGRCLNMEANPGQCYNLIDGWANQISSSGPDKGLVCVLFRDWNCKIFGSERPIQYPGSKDLRKVGINDAARSFKCAVSRTVHT